MARYAYLLRNCPAARGGRSGGRRKRVAKELGLALEVTQKTITVSLLVLVSTGVDVVHAVLEHHVDETGQLAGHGGDGFRSTQTSAQATKERAKGRLAVGEAQDGQAECCRCAIRDLLGGTIENFPSGDLVSRG